MRYHSQKRGLRALYSGWGPMIMRDIPFDMIEVGVNETIFLSTLFTRRKNAGCGKRSYRFASSVIVETP